MQEAGLFEGSVGSVELFCGVKPASFFWSPYSKPSFLERHLLPSPGKERHQKPADHLVSDREQLESY